MMTGNPYLSWLETGGSILLALIGVGLGWFSSRLPGRWWMIGYIVPLLLVVLLGLPNKIPHLYFVPPFSWLTSGRTEYTLAGILAAWLLVTPLSRLPRKNTRRIVILFLVILVMATSVMAFLGPAIIRNQLLVLETQIDVDGVCLQSNDYNCGPAAAVTALKRLGLEGKEGELAIWAHTSPFTGTAPDVLAEVLQKRYGEQGLTAQYRFFKTVQEMKSNGAVIAVIKYAFLVDHYVAVLEVGDGLVTVGDPLVGKTSISLAEFEEKWRFHGVVLTRKN